MNETHTLGDILGEALKKKESNMDSLTVTRAFLRDLAERRGRSVAIRHFMNLVSEGDSLILGAAMDSFIKDENSCSVVPTVWVKSTGEVAKKINAIKIVRSYTRMGLKEAKDFVEQCCFTPWSDNKLELLPGASAAAFKADLERDSSGMLVSLS